jgi:hypothetical protein
MKTIKSIFLTLTLLACSSLFAQQSNPAYTAVLSGTQAQIDQGISKGSFEFVIVGVEQETQAELIRQKAILYKNEIGFTLKKDNATGLYTGKVTLDDGRKDMRWVFRLFLSGNINTVKIENQEVPTTDFFQQYLKN